MKLKKNIQTTKAIIQRALTQLEYNIIDSSFNKIIAVSPSNIFSWGEEVTISLNQISNNHTEIKIESKPIAQLFTWGRNKKNITHISNRIKKLSSETIYN